MSVLITAFEPFGGDSTNSSLAALMSLPDFVMAGEKRVSVVKKTLPVVFGRCGEILRETMAEVRPDAVLCLGMAAGRAGITPECFAVNARYASAPDNDGNCFPKITPCDPDGPDGYRSTLPAEDMTEALQKAGIPAWLSFTAGTYVCNDLFYALMSVTAVPGGFVHVPQAAEDAPEGRAALAQAEINRGVLLLVSLLAEKYGL